jgi:hypothetical protein
MNERAMQANNHSPSVSTPLSATAISTPPTTTTSNHQLSPWSSLQNACKSMQKSVLVLQKSKKVIFSLTLFFL